MKWEPMPKTVPPSEFFFFDMWKKAAYVVVSLLLLHRRLNSGYARERKEDGETLKTRAPLSSLKYGQFRRSFRDLFDNVLIS